jgi:hypothetical protein
MEIRKVKVFKKKFNPFICRSGKVFRKKIILTRVREENFQISYEYKREDYWKFLAFIFGHGGVMICIHKPRSNGGSK